MSSFDAYAMTDKLNPAVLDVIITRLEARGKHPRFQQMMHDYFSAMHLDAMQCVLDLGCGTGVAARALAQHPSFTGQLTGIDVSPYLIAAAQRFSEEAGTGERIAFQVGDSRRLDLPDEQFDAVIAHTLVSHVDDPLAVLKQAARLVKPGAGPASLMGITLRSPLVTQRLQKGKPTTKPSSRPSLRSHG